MRKQHQVKDKLRLLETPGIKQLLLDYLLLVEEFDKRIPKPELVEKAHKVLRDKYKNEVKGQEVKSQQTDLETLIQKLASGEEKPWKNKTINYE